MNDWWLTILALYCNRKLNISKLLQNVGKLSMCGGTFHIKMFLIHSPWCHHSFTSHFFQSVQENGWVIHSLSSWRLEACLHHVWQCIKELKCFQNTPVLQNTELFSKHFSFWIPCHIECKKMTLILWLPQTFFSFKCIVTYGASIQVLKWWVINPSLNKFCLSQCQC